MTTAATKPDWSAYSEWTWREYLVQDWGGEFTASYNKLGAQHLEPISEHRSLKAAQSACLKHYRARKRAGAAT